MPLSTLVCDDVHLEGSGDLQFNFIGFALACFSPSTDSTRALNSSLTKVVENNAIHELGLFNLPEVVPLFLEPDILETVLARCPDVSPAFDAAMLGPAHHGGIFEAINVVFHLPKHVQERKSFKRIIAACSLRTLRSQVSSQRGLHEW